MLLLSNVHCEILVYCILLLLCCHTNSIHATEKNIFSLCLPTFFLINLTRSDLYTKAVKIIDHLPLHAAYVLAINGPKNFSFFHLLISYQRYLVMGHFEDGEYCVAKCANGRGNMYKWHIFYNEAGALRSLTVWMQIAQLNSVKNLFQCSASQ